MDILRANHLGCYGYEYDTSPAVDAFTAGAVLFDQTQVGERRRRDTLIMLVLANDAQPVSSVLLYCGYGLVAQTRVVQTFRLRSPPSLSSFAQAHPLSRQKNIAF